MNKYIAISFAIVLSLFMSGCDLDPFFTVSVTEEAIVTYNGNIVGEPRSPGLHFKIPFIQQVHLINVHVIREFTLPVPNSDYLHAKIMWSVEDSKKYFMASQNDDISQQVESTVDSVFNETINELDSETIILISQSQQQNPEYSNDTYEIIKKHIQESVNEFGIKIANVYFEQ